MPINLLTATAADLQARLAGNSITSKELVSTYLSQIAKHNDYLKAVIATTPEDLLNQRATELDNERTNGTVRGPLHGHSDSCQGFKPAPFPLWHTHDQH